MQIGGRPARQAPPHQGRNPVRDALWKRKPVQHIPHIVGYVVKLPEPAYKSSRSPVDPPQLLHPNPRETNEEGTAIIKAAEHKGMNSGTDPGRQQHSWLCVVSKDMMGVYGHGRRSDVLEESCCCTCNAPRGHAS